MYIGIFQGLVGLIHKDYKSMFKYVTKAIFITLGVTVLFGVIGFIVGKFDNQDFSNCCFPYKIQDGKSFMVVGSIHNFGYIGGEIGAFIGIAYQIIMKRKASV